MTGVWKIWMRVWCWATLALGALFVGAAIPGADAGALLFYDAIYWPLDGESGFAEPTRFTAGVLGAIMIGWAMCIFTAVDAAERLGAPVWRGLTAAMLTWYVIDGAVSISSGVPMNAASNTVFMATYLIPVLASGVLGAARPQTA
ncbi:MAG: hypothetical protein GC189_04395 [Alphaproteobacteria bacterium]|nr:hypothetical protein [Alphaproteobacteria bacterium]